MKDTFYCIAKFARRNNSGRMEKLPWVHFYQTNKQTNKKGELCNTHHELLEG